MQTNESEHPIFLQQDSYIAHIVPEKGRIQNMAGHMKGTLLLAEQNCPLPVLRNILRITAVLHDAGKFSPAFFSYMEDIQKNGEKARRQKVDHISAGGRIMEKMAEDELLSQLVGTAVYSHHGLQDCIDMETGESLSEKRGRREIRFDTVEERFFQVVDRESLGQWLRLARSDVQEIRSGIQEFVCRGGEETHGCVEFYVGMYERLILSVLIDSDWTDTACFFNEEAWPERIPEEELLKIWERAVRCFEEHMGHLTDFRERSPLDGYRNEISELCRMASQEEKRLYRLTVPAGAGKTLAGLRFALYHAEKYCKRHIFYVSPYNSILEQNAEEIRRAVGDKSLVLEHHCNVFYEDENEEREYQKLAESWDCPIVATTAVQMLNTLFSDQKSCIRRMYNLCNSVILFDEVQALPVRGMQLFYLAVNFLTEFCNTTVVLCSATQPSVVRTGKNHLFGCSEMAKLPAASADVFKRVIFEDKTRLIPGGMQPAELGAFAREQLHPYGSVLVILNTRGCAGKAYEALRQSCGGEYELYHLSNSMCPENRKEELGAVKEALRWKRKLICVSTQLIEAGVDLSFGCVIRSLAGLDSIIQAAGRCNRHKEVQRGMVYVIKMAQDAENLGKLEEIRRGREAAEGFLQYFHENPEQYDGSVDSQRSIKAYYHFYFKTAGPAAFQYPGSIPGTTLEELLGKNEAGQNQYKRRHGKKAPNPLLNQAFYTAGRDYRVISENDKVTVVIPYNEEAEAAISMLSQENTAPFRRKEAARRLQRYSVDVSVDWLKRSGDAVRMVENAGLLVLNGEYYSRKTGVLDRPESGF